MNDTPTADRPGSIFVYRLVEPGDVHARRDAIAKALFGGGGGAAVGQDGTYFEVLPESGAITWIDYGRAFAGVAEGDLPRSAEEVVRVAREHLARVGEALSRGEDAEGRPNPRFFPEDLRPDGVEPIYPPGGSAMDHWLVRFAVFLPTGARPGGSGLDPPAVLRPAPSPSLAAPASPPSPASPPAPAAPAAPALSGAPPALGENARVAGALVDVRVGRGGAVIGTHITWRPFRAVESVERTPPPEGAPPIQYVAARFIERQTLLTPYYAPPPRRAEAPAPPMGFRPASALSEVVEASEGLFLPLVGDVDDA